MHFSEPVVGLTSQDFSIPVGVSAAGCTVTGPNGTGADYVVNMTNCQNGTFALTLVTGSITDVAGNVGPNAQVDSATATQVKPTPVATPVVGTTPTTLIAVAPTAVFASISQSTQQTLLAAKILIPPAGVAGINVDTSLTQLTPADAISITTNQTVSAGDQVAVRVEASAAIANDMDACGFIEINGTWQYLGRQPFTGSWVSAAPMVFAEPGTYTLKIVLVDKNTVVNLSSIRSALSKPVTHVIPNLIPQTPLNVLSFGRASITASDTNIGTQQITINLNVVTPQSGLPQVINPAPPAAPVG